MYDPLVIFARLTFFVRVGNVAEHMLVRVEDGKRADVHFMLLSLLRRGIDRVRTGWLSRDFVFCPEDVIYVRHLLG